MSRNGGGEMRWRDVLEEIVVDIWYIGLGVLSIGCVGVTIEMLLKYRNEIVKTILEMWKTSFSMKLIVIGGMIVTTLLIAVFIYLVLKWIYTTVIKDVILCR